MADTRQARRNASGSAEARDEADEDTRLQESPMNLLKTILVNQDKLGNAQVLAIRTLISLKKSLEEQSSGGASEARRKCIPLEACFTKVSCIYRLKL